MKTRSLKTVATTLIAFMALVATSWAYLGSVGGSGSTLATVNASTVVVISAGTMPDASLLPTGEYTGDVAVALQNDTGATVRIASIQLDTARPNNGLSSTAEACGIAFQAQTNGGRGWELAPGPNQILLSDAAAMSTSAPDSCEGAQIRLFLKVA